MTTSSETRQEDRAGPVVERRLYRSETQRIVAGICGGLGEYFAVDPIWFRIGFVVLTIGGGSGVLIYLLMWLIVPVRPKGELAGETTPGTLTGAAVVGVVLVIAGGIALVNTAAPWLGRYVWPVVVIIGGLALLMGGLNRDRDR